MGIQVNFAKRLEHFTVRLDLCCPGGRVLALVGPSGSGKTTLVRIMAGLQRPDQGVVRMNGHTWACAETGMFVEARNRRVGYVFQEYGLFPHLTLAGNVGFAARDREFVRELMQRLGIWQLRKARPGRCSGGERQRAALAQALARRPGLLLLDEPFSALDAETRRTMHAVVLDHAREYGVPVVLVTHDLEEAATLGDRVVALRRGRVDPCWLERVRGLRTRHAPDPDMVYEEDAPVGAREAT
jgi:molybdate transport system ATP-binding protein